MAQKKKKLSTVHLLNTPLDLFWIILAHVKTSTIERPHLKADRALRCLVPSSYTSHPGTQMALGIPRESWRNFEMVSMGSKEYKSTSCR